jgi:hypothetical protein
MAVSGAFRVLLRDWNGGGTPCRVSTRASGKADTWRRQERPVGPLRIAQMVLKEPARVLLRDWNGGGTP